jgi:hypothetical protein
VKKHNPVQNKSNPRDITDVEIIEEEEWLASGGFDGDNSGSLNKLLRDSLKREIRLTDLRSVIQDKRFLDAIKLARKDLNLGQKYFIFADPTLSARKWLLSHLDELSPPRTPSSYNPNEDKLTNTVIKVANSLNLPPTWYVYIEHYIAIGKPPKGVLPSSSLKIKVLSTSNDKVLVELSRGLMAEDYRKAWGVLGSYLKRPKNNAPYAENLNNKIILDSIDAVGKSDIAKKYFSEEYADDPEAVRDKVKKKIKRSKKRFNKLS